ncbi:MAG: hypothetical protein VR67_11780 [Peptococcaceae bacterium BRH_c8a]|nr:MAG: hypothetical protein VR67_11780 [Peptococcaceae bacterium BRH_c8a]
MDELPYFARLYLISDIKRFAELMEQTRAKEFAFENITSMDLADYKAHLQTVKNRKADTINRAMSLIRMFCQ